MKKYKIYIVPHTHWDKEWYFIKDVSDVYLLDNMKNIFSQNEKHPDEALFCWDGQSSIIDDYLKFYPENQEKLAKLIKTKKLIVGPWYTQPDTFNTLGESIVRNLLIGTNIAKKLGHSMKVAYLPDTFGFNSNLPQIVSKTNNLGIINWRGAEDEFINHSLFNLWQAEDGSHYPVYNLFRHGYFTGVGGLLHQYHKNWAKENVVDWNPETRADELAKYYYDWVQNELNLLKPLSESTNHRILIPVGSDQMPMVHGWKQIVQALNKIDPEQEFILSDFESFFQDLINDKQVMKNAQTIKGQFRYGKYARAHKTIGSSRYDIKKLSRTVENLLYKELEPISVLYRQIGGEYEEKVIVEATKLLISCHAHDSLGGCNTDETNRAIVARLESAQGLVEGQITLIKKRIADSLDLTKNQTILFNLAPIQKKVKFNLDLNTVSQTFKLFEEGQPIDFSVEKQVFFDNDNFRILDSSAQFKNSTTITKNETEADSNATNILLADTAGRYLTSVYFELEMPGFGYKVIDVEEQNEVKLMAKTTNTVENDYYKLTFKNNQLTLFDKTLKKSFTDWLDFEACIDAGDTYDFSPPHDQVEPINVLNSITCYGLKDNHLSSLNLSYEYGFKKLKNHPSYGEQKQILKVNLVLKERLVDIKITIDNQVKDLRWRMILNSEIKNSIHSYADQSYSITSRKIHDESMKKYQAEKWVDVPIEIEACESLVYLKNADYSFAVFNQGTNEYQIIGKNDEKIAITLFRGVSLIGRRNLLYRPGRASGINDYPHQTPESNLLKELSFHLGVQIQKDTESLNSLAKEFNTRSVFYQRQSINQFLWKGDTFVLSMRPIKQNSKKIELLNLKNIDNLVVTTIKKQLEKEKFLIRLYNPTTKEILINSSQLVGECNLIDEVIPLKNKKIKPNEVRTFIIDF